jgi:hypothetical protein
MLHTIVKILGFASFGDQFQVGNAPSNGYTELMGVDDPGKKAPVLLSGACFHQKIVVPGK